MQPLFLFFAFISFPQKGFTIGWLIPLAALDLILSFAALSWRGLKKITLDFDLNLFTAEWYNFLMIEKKYEASLDSMRAILLDEPMKRRIMYSLLITGTEGFKMKIHDSELEKKDFEDLRLKLDEVYSRMEKFNI